MQARLLNAMRREFCIALIQYVEHRRNHPPPLLKHDHAQGRARSYCGPCLEGPQKGQWLDHSRPWINVAIAPGWSTRATHENDPLPPLRVRHGTYVWHKWGYWQWNEPPST